MPRMPKPPPRAPKAAQADPALPSPQVVFGANLRAARLKAGITQISLAAAVQTTPQYVQKIEAGQKNVTLATAEALANAVGRKAKDLLAPPAAKKPPE